MCLCCCFRRGSSGTAKTRRCEGSYNGATAAATGAITASVLILGQRAIYDPATALVGLLSLAVLRWFKLHEPIVVIARTEHDKQRVLAAGGRWWRTRATARHVGMTFNGCA